MRLKTFRLLSLFLFICFVQANAQTADEIINKHLAAIGGKEKLLALHSLIIKADMQMMGNSLPITITQVHNKGQRVDLDINGTNNFLIQTPEAGWMFFPVQGQAAPEATPPAVVKESIDMLDLQGSLLNYAEKGHSVEKLSNEDFEGVDCYRIKANMKNGLELTYYFDPSTYYIIKTVIKSKSSGQEVTQTQTFSDFRKVGDDYVFPFSMTGMGPGEAVIETIEVNPEIDEKIFVPNN